LAADFADGPTVGNRSVVYAGKAAEAGGYIAQDGSLLHPEIGDHCPTPETPEQAQMRGASDGETGKDVPAAVEMAIELRNGRLRPGDLPQIDVGRELVARRTVSMSDHP
jgi:hypothetical protein